MINSTIEAIGNAISAEFGNEYTIYSESVKQGLKEPCFFIFCINPTNTRFPGERFYRQNQFCVQYIPSDARENHDCNSVAERLYEVLAWIEVTGDNVMGSAMSYEITDGILSFFVNYNIFVKKILDYDVMEELNENTTVKG